MGSFSTIFGPDLSAAGGSLYGEQVTVKYLPSKYPIDSGIWKSVLALIYDGNTLRYIPTYVNAFGVGKFFVLADGTLTIGDNGTDVPRGSLPIGINFNYPDQEIYMQDFVSTSDLWAIGFRFTNVDNFYTFQFRHTNVNFDKMVGGTLTYGIASGTLTETYPRTFYVSSVGSTHSFYQDGVLRVTVSDTSLTSGGVTIAGGADYGSYTNRRVGCYLIKPYGSMPLPDRLPYRSFFIGRVVWDEGQKGYRVDFPVTGYSSIVDTDEAGRPIEPILVMCEEDVTLAEFTKLDKTAFIEYLKKKSPGHKRLIEVLEKQ